MTTPQESQPQEQKATDKELNFRALEQKYQRQLDQERQARMEAEKKAQEALKRNQNDEEEDDSEPYVDHKKLGKKLDKFGNQIRQQTQSEIQQAVALALQEERKANWLKKNPDFYDTLQNHADKIIAKDPELAEAILEMPDTFERQKLVYKNIKALELDKPAQKAPTIQEKVDANKRSPYYQPSGVGSAPYTSGGDFSAAGQKQAYNKLLELKNRLGSR